MSDRTTPPAQTDAPNGASVVLNQCLCDLLGASLAEPVEVLQQLWSGYGSITRYQLTYPSSVHSPAQPASVIVKSITPSGDELHPRGWNTQLSHRRKLHSYAVETHWYQHWASLCPDTCKVAFCYGVLTEHEHRHIVLEDLDAAGFSQRATTLTPQQAKICLRWLANFHGTFLRQSSTSSQQAPTSDWTGELWPIGTYWHLATRPDEWQAMPDSRLKQQAHRIDQRLNQCRHQTLVHGDAKVANFCFDPERQQAAAVDFQYVGAGCGIKDVVYFLGSCLSDTDCETYHDELMDDYFLNLKQTLSSSPQYTQLCPEALEQEWRSCIALAWADFQRFLLGWSPTHQKLNRFSQAMTERALQQLSTSPS